MLCLNNRQGVPYLRRLIARFLPAFPGSKPCQVIRIYGGQIGVRFSLPDIPSIVPHSSLSIIMWALYSRTQLHSTPRNREVMKGRTMDNNQNCVSYINITVTFFHILRTPYGLGTVPCRMPSVPSESSV